MVQALCRRNGTSPYSRSGSTKAELAAYPRDHFWRSTIAPRPSSPTMWNEFLPISMPIMAIALCAVAAMDRAASGARQSSGPGRHHMILIALFVYCNGAAQCGRWQRVLGKVFVREGAKMTGLLDGRIAVVTGGGSGIGRAIAQGYAKEGAQIAVLDINGDAAAQTAKSITTAGGKATSTPAPAT